MSYVKEGYKQTKVGVIPEDWKHIKIKDTVKVSQGLQIAISNRFLTPAENRVFYITIPYIEGKKEEYIENPKQSTLCKKDDILVVRTGSVGKIIRGVEGAFHNNFFKVTAINNIYTNFFYYFLISPKTQFLMNKYAGNSAIPDLNHGDFYSLDFLIPPLKEQQKIANILSTWDSAISKQEELITQKEKLKKGLMQKLLSGEVRFGGFDDEWEDVRFLDIIKYMQSGLSRKLANENIGIPVIRSNNIQNYTININGLKYWYKHDNQGACLKNYFLKYGDILINFINSLSQIGKMAVYRDEIIGNVIFTTNILRIRFNDSVLIDFIQYIFQQERYNSFISSITKPAVNQASFTTKDFKKFHIKLPTLKEQQKIAEVLTLVDKEIELLKNELEQLKTQKKGLMQKLLTGEVRVKL